MGLCYVILLLFSTCALNLWSIPTLSSDSRREREREKWKRSGSMLHITAWKVSAYVLISRAGFVGNNREVESNNPWETGPIPNLVWTGPPTDALCRMHIWNRIDTPEREIDRVLGAISSPQGGIRGPRRSVRLSVTYCFWRSGVKANHRKVSGQLESCPQIVLEYEQTIHEFQSLPSSAM